MPKLKALRGAVGIYGRVKANGIVEVEEKDVEKLLKSKRFVRATAADIAAAEEAQKAYLTVNTTGTAPGFSPLAAPRQSDRLQAMIDAGAITKEKAKELVDLQISLSDDEIRSFIDREIAAKGAELAATSAEILAAVSDIETRDAALNDREAALNARESALDDREKALAEAAASATVPDPTPEADTAKPSKREK